MKGVIMYETYYLFWVIDMIFLSIICVGFESMKSKNFPIVSL